MARLLVLGQSGAGKSWALGALIERVLDSEHPEHPDETFDFAVHFDPEDEEQGLSGQDNRPLLGTYPVDVQKARETNWQMLIAKRKRLRVVPDMSADNMRQLFGTICQAAFRLCKDHLPEKTCLLSCDESGQIVTQHGAHDAALTIQTRGRKYGVETIHSAQRPQQLHTTLLSQTDRRLYFRIKDSNALRQIDKQAGFNVGRVPVDSDRIGPRDGLADLPDRTVVLENVDSGDIAVESTEDWTRVRNHYSGDDGTLDSALSI